MSLSFVLGDNLGVAELLGFKQSFSRCLVCRYCGATHQEINESVIADRQLNLFKSINLEEEYASMKNPKYKSGLGLKRSSSLIKTGVSIFKVSPPDVFHDIAEGILPTICSLVLSYSKIKRGTILRKIEEFPWINGPVVLDSKFELKGKGIQKFEFFTRLVEMLPEWLDSNENYSLIYFSFKKIVFLAWGSSATPEDIRDLEKEISFFMEVYTTFH